MSQSIVRSRLVLAFLAGFIAVLTFHQGVLALLHAIGIAARAPYATSPTQPFGIPQVWSLAFWGGVWGLGLAAILPRFSPPKDWLTALMFGAIAPTLVAWFIVAPLKGQPIAGGGNPTAILTALLVNGAWGVGTAWLIRLLDRKQAPS